MLVGRIERYLVGVLGLVVALAIAIQAATVIRAEFSKVNAALSQIMPVTQEVRR